jgi:hypothetical protein
MEEERVVPEEQSEEEKKPPLVVMQCASEYSLSEEGGKQTAGGEAQARLDEDNLSILPKFGEALLIPLRDISRIVLADYTIELTLTSKEKLTLSKLGRGLEDLFRGTSQLRNEMMLRDMLMAETVVKSAVRADFVYLDENHQEKQKGTCEPRLYETAMVVITDRGDLFRIPYSDVANIREEAYQVTIDTEFGESFVLSRMGKEFEPWKRGLAESINALTVRVQSSLKELLPTSDPSNIRRVARLMKEGKAARRLDIEAISPDLWVRLEKKLEAIGMKDEYSFFNSLAQKKRMCIGMKRGLMGDLTGEYIWFLAPIYSTNPKEPGNAIAMEAASTEGGGKATYFFQITSRVNYPTFKSLDDLHAEVDRVIGRMNRCMLAINFRREPIYLSEEQLGEPPYVKYQYAVQKIPELRELRRLFIGRVIHSSQEHWQQDIRNLLAFNVSSAGDGRWEGASKPGG